MIIEDVFKKYPLYEKVAISNESDNINVALEVFQLLYAESSFDMYCTQCKSLSIFRRKKREYYGTLQIIEDNHVPIISNGQYTIEAECSRNSNHKAIVFVLYETPIIIKIGQFPSLADILSPNLRRYKSAIGEQRLRDWSKAIGLTAHGIGAGSFVYLRRIIESLIEDAHNNAKNKNEWDEDKYTQSRFTEKIQMLSGYLPDFMVQNRAAYSILSKGVHELDEDLCLEYFPAINSVIELIAEEKLASVEIEKRKNATQNTLSKIAQEIK